MDYREYKLMQIAGIALACIALVIADAEFYPVSFLIFAIMGGGIFLTGLIGAWLNDD